MRRLALPALLLLAAAAPPPAAAGPPLLPTRDVAVVYDVTTAQGMAQERLFWDQARHRLRVEPPSPGLYMIVDYATQRMQMVRDPQRVVIEAPAPNAALGVSSAGGTAAGTDMVAGLACTRWITRDSEGGTAELCVTGDGVTLRVVKSGRTLLAAAAVSFAPQPAQLFAAPSEYRHADISEFRQ
jgi:hypothetical protein